MDVFRAAPTSKKRMTLLGIFTAMFSSVFVASGNSTLLPAVAADIGGMAIYPMANALASPVTVSVMPLWGFLAARDPSLKRPLAGFSFLAGFVVVLSRAFATNIWGVIIPSVLWGFVSAGVYVLCYTMIRDLYDTKKAGLFLGITATVQALGLLVGPFLTGLIIDNFGWRTVCHVTWPLLLFASLFTLMGVKVSKDDAKPLAVNLGKFDLPGACCLVVFLLTIILGLSTGASIIPFGSPLSNTLLTISAISLIAFIIVIKQKGNSAILPLAVLKDQNTLLLALCNFCYNFSNMATFFFIPAYIISVMGGLAVQAGMSISIMSVLGIFLGPILGRAIAKSGNARTIATIGTSTRIALTLVLLFFLTPTTPLYFIFTIMFLAGFYSSQAGVTSATAPQIQIKPELRQLSNSVIQIGQGFGASLGLAIYTMIIGSYGIVTGMKISLILAIITAVIALFLGLGLKKLDTHEYV